MRRAFDKHVADKVQTAALKVKAIYLAAPYFLYCYYCLYLSYSIGTLGTSSEINVAGRCCYAFEVARQLFLAPKLHWPPLPPFRFLYSQQFQLKRTRNEKMQPFLFAFRYKIILYSYFKGLEGVQPFPH